MTQPAFVCGYAILEELGRGTTGTVYLARHPVVRPDRQVALKLPSLGSGPESGNRIARYQNEWNALRVLTWEPDAAIPTLYDVGCDSAGQNNYYVREFVEGGTLEQLVGNRAIDVGGGIRVLSTIAGAVHRMHGRGIAHRNLQASNVLVRTDGAPKLIGFGRVEPLGGAVTADKRGLHELVRWLFEAVARSVPPDLDRALWEATTLEEVEAALHRHQ